MRRIELAATSLSPAEAESELGGLLRAYGATLTAALRSGADSLTVNDGNGNLSQLTYAELITQLHLTGTCELHRLRWRDTDPHGTVAAVVPDGIPVVVGTGPRTSAPLQGPGYITSDVVGEMLDDVLFFRKQVAEFSHEEDMFRPAFRAYRGYLASCVSAIDAFLNRLSWFARNDTGTSLSPKDLKLLSRKSLPLDEKLRTWLPVITGGRSVSESGPTWASYQAVRTARNALVHVNEPDFLFAIRDAVDVLNLCRAGVGELLWEAGNLLGRNASSAVFRVARAPLARYVPRQ